MIAVSITLPDYCVLNVGSLIDCEILPYDCIFIPFNTVRENYLTSIFINCFKVQKMLNVQNYAIVIYFALILKQGN